MTKQSVYEVNLGSLFLLNTFESKLVRLKAVEHYKHAFYHDINQEKHVTFIINDEDHVSVCAAGLLKAYIAMFSRVKPTMFARSASENRLKDLIPTLEHSVVVIIGHPFDLEVFRSLEGKHRSVFWMVSTNQELREMKETTTRDFFYPLVSGETEWWMAWHVLISEVFIADEDFRSLSMDYQALSSSPAFHPVKEVSPEDHSVNISVATALFSACFADKEQFFKKIALSNNMAELMDAVFWYFTEAQHYKPPAKFFRKLAKVADDSSNQELEVAVVFGNQYRHEIFSNRNIAYAIYVTLSQDGEINIAAVPSWWSSSHIFNAQQKTHNLHGIVRYVINETDRDGLLDAIIKSL